MGKAEEWGQSITEQALVRQSATSITDTSSLSSKHEQYLHYIMTCNRNETTQTLQL